LKEKFQFQKYDIQPKGSLASIILKGRRIKIMPLYYTGGQVALAFAAVRLQGHGVC